jgi:hypothetical protein
MAGQFHPLGLGTIEELLRELLIRICMIGRWSYLRRAIAPVGGWCA